MVLIILTQMGADVLTQMGADVLTQMDADVFTQMTQNVDSLLTISFIVRSNRVHGKLINNQVDCN